MSIRYVTYRKNPIQFRTGIDGKRIAEPNSRRMTLRTSAVGSNGATKACSTSYSAWSAVPLQAGCRWPSAKTPASPIPIL